MRAAEKTTAILAVDESLTVEKSLKLLKTKAQAEF